MALITRVSRLFRADLHAVLDRVEEPDVLLKQAVREMEEDIARDRQRAKALNHQHTQLTARQADLDQSLYQIEEELDVCFTSGKDDLARTLIKRKLEAQRLSKILNNKREKVADTLAELRNQIDEHCERLTSMQQKVELISEEETSTSSEDVWITPALEVCDEDVEVAFLREKQKRNRS